MAKKMKKPNLKNALKKVDNTSDKFFGKIDVDLDAQPVDEKINVRKLGGEVGS